MYAKEKRSAGEKKVLWKGGAPDVYPENQKVVITNGPPEVECFYLGRGRENISYRSLGSEVGNFSKS